MRILLFVSLSLFSLISQVHAQGLGDYSRGQAYSAKIATIPHRVAHICSKHEVHLVNNESYTIAAAYQFGLCVGNNACNFKLFTQYLKANEVFDYQDEVCQDIEFSESGSYNMTARTKILTNPSVDVKHNSTITVY